MAPLEPASPASSSTSTLALRAAPKPRWRRALAAAAAWVRGPQPPVDVTFRPWFPAAQSAPSRAVARRLRRRWQRVAGLGVFWAAWAVLFGVVVHYSRFADAVDGLKPYQFSCSTALWSKNDGCGLNGTSCLPFANNTFAFRCPASCVASGRVLNPRAVGDAIALYQPFVVGGPPSRSAPAAEARYRADSFICPAAIHAGVVSDALGGCGIVSQVGAGASFAATARHGIRSLGFDGAFPSSYAFAWPRHTRGCRDLRWHLLGVSVPFTAAVCVLATHPAVVLASVFTGAFFHVALASDPPQAASPYALVSTALARFLPAAFAGWVLYLYVLRPVHAGAVFTSGRAAVERAALLLAGLWVGALNNETFERIIPIQRLTAHDLAQQPGARGALVVIIVLLAAIAAGQVHYLRLAGQLPRMLGVYAGLGAGLGLLAAIPGEALRIHHYILALLLLPGTRVATRASLLYHGLLLGLFVDGIARWGWDGIVQTPAELAGDQLVDSSTPVFSPPPEVGADNVTVFWEAPPAGEAWDGVEVLVNDVERFQWRADEAAAGGGGGPKGNGTRGGEFTWPWSRGEKLYFRLGYYSASDGAGDFTAAGVVERDGSWTKPGNWST